MCVCARDRGTVHQPILTAGCWAVTSPRAQTEMDVRRRRVRDGAGSASAPPPLQPHNNNRNTRTVKDKDVPGMTIKSLFDVDGNSNCECQDGMLLFKLHRQRINRRLTTVVAINCIILQIWCILGLMSFNSSEFVSPLYFLK